MSKEGGDVWNIGLTPLPAFLETRCAYLFPDKFLYVQDYYYPWGNKCTRNPRRSEFGLVREELPKIKITFSPYLKKKMVGEANLLRPHFCKKSKTNSKTNQKQIWITNYTIEFSIIFENIRISCTVLTLILSKNISCTSFRFFSNRWPCTQISELFNRTLQPTYVTSLFYLQLALTLDPIL